VLALSGCAPAAPLLLGGRTVPRGRTDLAVGGAARVPLGALAPDPIADDPEQVFAFGAPGGLAPVALVRHGVSDQVDVGLDVAGSSLRGALRGDVVLASNLRLLAALAPHAGLVERDGELAFRGGALGAVALAVEIFSLYEAWVGPRISIEHVTGALADRAVELSALRLGGVVGLGVGFRRLHVLLELAVDYERWWGQVGDRAVLREGVALTPAFAVRLRL
jgi:hypothetical protein